MRAVTPSLLAVVVAWAAGAQPTRADRREIRVNVSPREDHVGDWIRTEPRSPVWVQWTTPVGSAWPCGPQPSLGDRCVSYDEQVVGWHEVLVGESVGTWSASMRLDLDGTEEEIEIAVRGNSLEIEIVRRSSALRLEDDPDDPTRAVLINDGPGIVHVGTTTEALRTDLEWWSGPWGAWYRFLRAETCAVGYVVHELGPGDRIPVRIPNPWRPSGLYRAVVRTRSEELRRDGDVRVTTSYRIARELSIPRE